MRKKNFITIHTANKEKKLKNKDKNTKQSNKGSLRVLDISSDNEDDDDKDDDEEENDDADIKNIISSDS